MIYGTRFNYHKCIYSLARQNQNFVLLRRNQIHHPQMIGSRNSAARAPFTCAVSIVLETSQSHSSFFFRMLNLVYDSFENFSSSKAGGCDCSFVCNASTGTGVRKSLNFFFSLLTCSSRKTEKLFIKTISSRGTQHVRSACA